MSLSRPKTTCRYNTAVWEHIDSNSVVEIVLSLHVLLSLSQSTGRINSCFKSVSDGAAVSLSILRISSDSQAAGMKSHTLSCALMCQYLYLDAHCWLKFISSSAGIPVLCATLRLPPAEEHRGAAAQQRSAEPGENHPEATTPSAG